MARRRSSLRPVGLELFFITPEAAAGGGGGAGAGSPDLAAALAGPRWDSPSAFFAFRWGEGGGAREGGGSEGWWDGEVGGRGVAEGAGMEVAPTCTLNPCLCPPALAP